MTAPALVFSQHGYPGYATGPYFSTVDLVAGDNLIVIYLRADNFATIAADTLIDGTSVTPITGSQLAVATSRDSPTLFAFHNSGAARSVVVQFANNATYAPSWGVYVLDMNGYDLTALTDTINFNFAYRPGSVPDRSTIPREPFQTLDIVSGGVGIVIFTSDVTGGHAGNTWATASGGSGGIGYNENTYCTREFDAQVSTGNPYMFDAPYSGDDMVGYAFAAASTGPSPINASGSVQLGGIGGGAASSVRLQALASSALSSVGLSSGSALLIKGAQTTALAPISASMIAKAMLGGSSSTTLNRVSATAAAKVVLGAVASRTLNPISASVVAKLLLNAAAATTLDAIRPTLAAQLLAKADASNTLQPIILVAGSQSVTFASFSISLDGISTSFAAITKLQSASTNNLYPVSAVLAAITKLQAAQTGVIGPIWSNIQAQLKAGGALSITLDPIQLSATSGLVIPLTGGNVSTTLGYVSASSAAVLKLQAVSTPFLDYVASTSNAFLKAQAALGNTLADITGSSAAQGKIQALATAFLGPISNSASSALILKATFSSPLGSLRFQAAGGAPFILVAPPSIRVVAADVLSRTTSADSQDRKASADAQNRVAS